MIAVIFSLAFTRKDQPQYFTAKVERGSVRDVVDATGTINAVTTVLVGSQISGRIAKLSADFNSVVRKGQVIAEIDPALFEGALLQAVADLKSAQVNVLAARANLDKAKSLHLQAKADYERAATLSKQDSIAMQAVDLAKATYDAAAATVEASVAAVQQAEAQVSQKEGAVAVARTNLEYTVIRSPINGTVVARNVDVGQTVAASLQAPTLFTIAQDLTKMQVYAKTDETNVGKVRAGRPVTFKVDAFPKDTFKGVVSQVRMNPVTVQNVVNYDAIIDFDNPELKLFPGMTAYVTIPVASAENVLKIPNGALRYTPRLSKAALEELQANPGIEAESGIVVWKLRPDNSVDPVRLALGITDHSYTVVAKVLSGDLREGDDLITGAVPSKRDSGAPPAGGPPRK
ncbi:MAG TPA: efflux RND transporter periplasmic adaptor subunit [Burkholderiales bacterium]|nr:efflux RND transporter periplasmic adaptor subunit [Burkholderiales bacterium]